MRGAAFHPVVAAGLVFVSSGAVLVLEILGIRLLAPYVGLTIETTTVIIGTVLAGIATGAAVGGRAADELDPRRLLAGLLAAGGALAIATVPIARGLGSALQEDASAAAALIAALALFPPAAVLSAVTPTVARVQLRDLATTGAVVGRLSAWATAGGLVGTFATGFVVVPLLPTDVAVVAVGGVLVVLGLAVAPQRRRPGGRRRRARPGRRHAGGGRAVRRRDRLPLRARGGGPGAAGRTHAEARAAPPLLRRPPGPDHLEFDYTRWMGDAVDDLPTGRSRPSSSAAAGSRCRATSPPRGRARARACWRSTATWCSSCASGSACAPGRTCAYAWATRA